MPFARGDMRDHIVSHKNDHGASYGRYAVLQRWSRLKISFCEIFGVVQFSIFATLSRVQRTCRASRDTSEFDPVWSGRALQEDFNELAVSVLHQCIRPLVGGDAPGHHGYQRACDLISGWALDGPFGSPVFTGAGKTEPPSRLILSQTSAGKSLRELRLARLDGSTTGKNTPGDARKHVSECDCQNVVMKSLLGDAAKSRTSARACSSDILIQLI